LLRHFRRPAAILPRERTAAAGNDAHRHRARIDARVGPLCRADGQDCRHEDVRRLGTAQGTAAQVRIRAGADCGACHRDAEEQAMTPQSREAESGEEERFAPPCAMVIFGAAGDLTKRLVVPALYNLAAAKRLPEGFRLTGVDLAAKTTDEWRRGLRDAMDGFIAKGGAEFDADHLDAAAWRWLSERMSYVQ